MCVTLGIDERDNVILANLVGLTFPSHKVAPTLYTAINHFEGKIYLCLSQVT